MSSTSSPTHDQSALIGQRFGRLVVEDVFRKDGKILCSCLCDCGNRKIIAKSNLRRNGTKSCGCIRRERQHGKSRTRIYKIYTGMKCRCQSPKCVTYPKYGKRGISVCDEWLGDNGFVNFYQWAMSHGYNDTLSIDRIDPKGNYCPENCRWATAEEQNTHLSMLKTNKSGIVGVSWSKSENKWVSAISINNKSKRIGSYNTKREAAEARNRFIKENHLPHQLAAIPCETDAGERPKQEERFEKYTAQTSLFD